MSHTKLPWQVFDAGDGRFLGVQPVDIAQGDICHAPPIGGNSGRVRNEDRSNMRLIVRNVTAFARLEALCGYVGDSSDTVVTISQDDATRTWIVTVGTRNAKNYHGDSLIEALKNAADGEGVQL